MFTELGHNPITSQDRAQQRQEPKEDNNRRLCKHWSWTNVTSSPHMSTVTPPHIVRIYTTITYENLKKAPKYNIHFDVVLFNAYPQALKQGHTIYHVALKSVQRL